MFYLSINGNVAPEKTVKPAINPCPSDIRYHNLAEIHFVAYDVVSSIHLLKLQVESENTVLFQKYFKFHIKSEFTTRISIIVYSTIKMHY